MGVCVRYQLFEVARIILVHTVLCYVCVCDIYNQNERKRGDASPSKVLTKV